MYGALINLLTLMKGLPLAYNRDMQEDKQPMFDAIETTGDSLEMMALILRETTFNHERMESAARGELMATEIADYLVRAKNVPFREAHHITGTIVSFAEKSEKNLDEISLDEYRSFSEHFGPDLFEYLDPRKSIGEKKSAEVPIPTWYEKRSPPFKAAPIGRYYSIACLSHCPQPYLSSLERQPALRYRNRLKNSEMSGDIGDSLVKDADIRRNRKLIRLH